MSTAEMSSTPTPREKPDHSRSGISEPALGRLWNQYLKIRDQPRGSGKRKLGDETQIKTSRQAACLKNRLVVSYSPLVKYVAGRVGARMPPGAVEQEDMLSWGILGLLDAIETYNPDHPGRKAKFETYANFKIRWAMLDQLRSQDWVPRSLRSRAREVERARYKLAQKLRRPPTETEIAKEADIELAEYHDFLEKYSRAHVASLEAPMEGVGGEKTGIELGMLVKDPLVVDPQSHANQEDLRTQLIGAISRLEERERLVTTFYFYEGLTLKEIGKALNLTEGRVSQILKRTLDKLRSQLQEEGSEWNVAVVDHSPRKLDFPLPVSAGSAVFPATLATSQDCSNGQLSTESTVLAKRWEKDRLYHPFMQQAG
jgi:RNA polymerase sigma factor for flagellar operon FliA